MAAAGAECGHILIDVNGRPGESKLTQPIQASVLDTEHRILRRPDVKRKAGFKRAHLRTDRPGQVPQAHQAWHPCGRLGFPKGRALANRPRFATRLRQLICRTTIEGLDLVVSNDVQGQLNTLLLHAPDGRLRLRNLRSLVRPHYHLLLSIHRAHATYCWRWRFWRPTWCCRRPRRRSSRPTD